MNIAILVPALENKGPVIVARDLCIKFCEQGHRCEVLYFNNKKARLHFPCKTRKISLWEHVDLSKFDIVHIHCLKPAIYVWLHCHTIKLSRVVVTLHQPITYFAYRLAHNTIESVILSWVSKLVYKPFKNVVVLSEVQKKLAEPILKRHVKVIYNGRDIVLREPSNKDDICQVKQLSNNYKIIGTTSVIIRRKGLEQMVVALQQLPECAFVCVGNGPELQTLKELAQSLGVDSRCLWLGYRQDAVNYLPYFDVYVMCTRSEGFPLAFIEAAGAQRACVLSDIDILKCIVPDDCVRFYQLDNIESLSGNIRFAINNKEQYGYRLFEYYNKALTATIMANNYEILYRNIINDKYE